MTTRTRPLSALNAVRSAAASGPNTVWCAVGPWGSHPAAVTHAAAKLSLRKRVIQRAGRRAFIRLRDHVQ